MRNELGLAEKEKTNMKTKYVTKVKLKKTKYKDKIPRRRHALKEAILVKSLKLQIFLN